MPPIERCVRLSPAMTVALLLWLTVLCHGTFGQAQSFDATDLRKPTDLAGNWLINANDDPANASPTLDDSHWTTFDPTKQSLHEVFRSRSGVVWYRLHVKLASQPERLALLEHGISQAFEIYLNGEQVLKVCRVVPYSPCVSPRLLIPISDSQMAGGTLLIALRVAISNDDWGNPSPGFYPSTLKLGPEDALWNKMWLANIGENAVSWLDEWVVLVMGLGALLLFWTQRDRSEYLWLFLLVLCEVPNIVFDQFSISQAMPSSWWRACQLVGLGYAYFFARMFCSFFGHRFGWKLQAAAILSSAGFLYLYTSDLLGAPNHFLSLLAYTPFFLLAVVVLPIVLIPYVRRGKSLEGVILIPLALAALEFLANWIAFASDVIPSWQAPVARYFGAAMSPRVGPSLHPHQGLFTLDMDPAIRTLQMGSLALIILIRSNRISHQKAVIESELENARELQQVIVPDLSQPVPGFKIESVYKPARELGGDFFQVLPSRDAGVLLVIGDVAGKGLPAALLVSILIGAVRMLAEETLAPEKILSRLNEVLMGRTRGGFSTALVAEISRDGCVALVNAGHLPPLLDGRDVEIAGALPLGVLAGVTYESSRFQLPVGSRLTFLTDGVSEAQDASGELFGFERARAISTKAAADIAEAAREYGQQDDITVLTIERVV